MDVVEDLADEVWIGNVTDDAKLPATEGADGDVDFKDALQCYVTRRCAQVSGGVSGSLQSLRDSLGEHCRVAGTAAGSLCLLRWRALVGVGTIARRIGELGAKTPW